MLLRLESIDSSHSSVWQVPSACVTFWSILLARFCLPGRRKCIAGKRSGAIAGQGGCDFDSCPANGPGTTRGHGGGAAGGGLERSGHGGLCESGGEAESQMFREAGRTERF